MKRDKDAYSKFETQAANPCTSDADLSKVIIDAVDAASAISVFRCT